MSTLNDDPTLDEIRDWLAPRLPGHAAFDGWSAAAVTRAAEEAGIDPAIARLAFPDGGVVMIDAWFSSVDRAMTAAVPADRLATMKVRDKIRALVIARLEQVAPHREALRRAVAVLAMPQNMAAGARLGWRSADLMWVLAGDKATDYNHYSKRAMLAAVYASTVMALLDDEDADFPETRAFLDRRIDNIMQFEKAKARWMGRSGQLPSLSRFIGRLRYPAV